MQTAYHEQIASAEHIPDREVNILLLHHLGDLHQALGRLLHAVRQQIILGRKVVELASLLLEVLLRLLDRQLS